MAISPKAARQPTEDDVATADFLEEDFDKVLAEGKRTMACRWPNEKVRQILRQRYKAAGWTDLKFHSDQREGQWIEAVEEA